MFSSAESGVPTHQYVSPQPLAVMLLISNWYFNYKKNIKTANIYLILTTSSYHQCSEVIPVKAQTNCKADNFMNHIFSLVIDTDFMDICILIFYKPSSVPKMYSPPTCLPLLVDDRPPPPPPPSPSQWGDSSPIKMHHLENLERPSGT